MLVLFLQTTVDNFLWVILGRCFPVLTSAGVKWDGLTRMRVRRLVSCILSPFRLSSDTDDCDGVSRSADGGFGGSGMDYQ